MTSARARTLAATFLLLWSCALGQPAAAQTAATSEKAGAGSTTELQEIVVSNTNAASKVTSKGAPPPAYAGGQVARGGNVGILGNKDFMNTPFSTSSYTEKTIRDQQAQTVGQVLINSEPAVRASIDGNTNRTDTLTVRGFRVDNHDFALNGVYGLVPDYRTNAAPIERIEILRGPAAFLYGISPFGVIGGTVNVVTKRALDEPLTRFTTFYLSTSRAGEQFDISRRYGDQKQLGIRVNGTLVGGATAINRQSTQAGALSIGADYTGERIRIYEDIIYQNDSFRGQQRGDLPARGVVLPAAPDPRINVAQGFSYSFATSITTLTRAEYDVDKNIGVYGAVGVNRFTFRRLEDPGPTLNGPDGDATGTTLYQRGSTFGVSAQIGGRVHFDTGPIKHEAVVSADSLDQTFRLGTTSFETYQTNIFRPVLMQGPGNIASTTPLGKSATNRPQSVGIGDTLSVLDDKIQLTVGVRRQQIASKNFAAGGASVTSASDTGATSPAVALLLRPTQQLSFYGNFIEGLTVLQAPSSVTNANQIFPPAKAQQYEAGAKLDLGRIAATLAFFQISQQVGITDATNVFTIAGQQRNRGMEFYTFGEVWRGLRVIGGVALLDPRLTKTANNQYNGNVGIGAPRLQSNLGVEWDTPFVRGLTAIGRVIYTSRAFVSLDNTQSVPDWTTLDLGLRYETALAGKPVVFRATVTNVLDNYYFVGNPSGYLFNGPPRTLLASMSTDF